MSLRYERKKQVVNAKNQFLWEVFHIDMNKGVFLEYDLWDLPMWNEIKCAEIVLYKRSGDVDELTGDLNLKVMYTDEIVEVHEVPIRLKIGFSRDDIKEFLNHLDFNYEYEYADEENFPYRGCIWLEEGSWFFTKTLEWERGSYDVWSFNKMPEIPDDLL